MRLLHTQHGVHSSLHTNTHLMHWLTEMREGSKEDRRRRCISLDKSCSKTDKNTSTRHKTIPPTTLPSSNGSGATASCMMYVHTVPPVSTCCMHITHQALQERHGLAFFGCTYVAKHTHHLHSHTLYLLTTGTYQQHQTPPTLNCVRCNVRLKPGVRL